MMMNGMMIEMMCMYNSFSSPLFYMMHSKNSSTDQENNSYNGKVANDIPYSDSSLFFCYSNNRFLSTKAKWNIVDNKFYFEIV